MSNLFRTRSYLYLKKTSVIIIPVIYLILAILIHFINGKFFLLNTDPEYFHFLNGLNLSIFNLAVEYIDHPGTTVQVLFAVSAHIVNLLFPGTDIITNALNHPEEFIHGANILLNTCIAFTLFLLGYKSYQYTGNILLSLLLQLAPFCSARVLIIAGRIMPESVIIIPILFLILLTIKYIYDDNGTFIKRNYVLAFAIIGGLGMATKILYLPFLIIPLILFESKKHRLQYLLYTTLASIVFAFPIFVNISKSWNWYVNILLHSGKWGSGESNIIDLSEVPNRIQQIFNVDRLFFILIGIAIIQLIIFYSLRKLRSKDHRTRFLKRALMAMVTTIFIFVIFVTKHFAYHYIIPVLVLKVFVIFLMVSIILDMVRSKSVRRFISLATFLFAILITIPQSKKLSAAVLLKQSQAAKFETRYESLESYNRVDNTLIISSHYRGAPFIQAAMAGGFMLSGQLRSTFKQQLDDKYPNTYLYVSWSDQFYRWDEFKEANEFIDPLKPVYVFIGEGKESDLDIILKRIDSHFHSYEINLELLFYFKDPDEYFYKLTFLEKDH